MLGSILRVLVAGLVLGCAAGSAQGTPCGRPGGTPFRDEHWRAALPAHPLVGQVLKGETPIAIEPGACVRSPLQQLIAEVWQTIREDGVVLLGEMHDNVEHHRVRGDILRGAPRLDASQPPLRPAAVFEHLRPDQQGAIDQVFPQMLRSDLRFTAADLLDSLRWKESGWPAAALFLPLFDAVLDAHLPIHTGDAPRERMKALARGDRGGLSEADLALIKLGEDLPRPLVHALDEELVGSHCGLMPASAFGSLNLAQRFRDAHLARALLGAAQANGAAFLLAGNGHVRTDRAVPWYVRRMAPDRRIVSVMLLEVKAGDTEAAGYLPRDPDGKIAVDYVLFTPRTERADPCQQMRERYTKKQ